VAERGVERERERRWLMDGNGIEGLPLRVRLFLVGQ
jgi:hypothetical protein